MEELPPNLPAYPTFLTDVFFLYPGIARDIALGVLFSLASAVGLVVVVRVWNLYSAVTLPIFVFAVIEAIDRFQAASGT